MRMLFALAAAATAATAAAAKHTAVPRAPRGHVAVSEMVKAGAKPERVMAATKVGPLPGINATSYAGFIEVNATAGANHFYWFVGRAERPRERSCRPLTRSAADEGCARPRFLAGTGPR